MSDYYIVRRHTSRLSLRIGKGGEVRVSAPYIISDTIIQDFVESHREWIAHAQQRTLEREQMRHAFYAQLPLTTRAQREEAKLRLEQIVRPMLIHYSEIMGVCPQSVSYRATCSRWGSCHTGRRTISFSLYLLLLPLWCIEHTVVHELAHLIVPNHSPRFYTLMDRYFPRWREARAETRHKRLSPLK